MEYEPEMLVGPARNPPLCFSVGPRGRLNLCLPGGGIVETPHSSVEVFRTSEEDLLTAVTFLAQAYVALLVKKATGTCDTAAHAYAESIVKNALKSAALGSRVLREAGIDPSRPCDEQVSNAAIDEMRALSMPRSPEDAVRALREIVERDRDNPARPRLN